MDRNHLYRYCEHCEEFISARTFLRHKEAYYDDHTRIWSKDCQSVPSTSEDEGDDGGAIQLNSGSDNSEGLSDDEMDNSTAELQATEDCLEDEVDDGEVWEGVNVSEIEGRFSSFVAQMTTIFPTSIIGLHSCLNVNSNDFRRLVSCPKCHTLYEFEKCFVDKAKMIPKVCSFSKFPNHPHRSRRQHCGSQLLRAVVTKDGDHKFYPLKVYCYKPLIESLQTLLSKPGVLNSCEHWRERKIPKDTLCDIYDGKIWEEFQYVNGSAFLAAPHNIGLMMNVDWFTPFKHTPYSVGAVYLSVMNLPRSKRFLKENMILFGLIPGPNEPPLNINSYLEPLVEELKVLWSEGMVINMPDNPGQQVHLKAGLLCVACDIPAARKVCGFLGHMAKLGCSKCTKEFHINCETGHACFGCFDDGEDESPLRNESDHREQADLASMQTTQAARDRIESQYGSRFTALMLLEYFDCVRFHIVDPMHNLFLGTAKHIMKNVWLDDIEPIIPKRFHAMMQEKVDKCETPSSMGRIPHKIASSFSSFTADQWKTWTMVFSMYALHGVLEQEHLECWYLFVQACNILVSPMLKIHDAMEGHKLLLQFCKQFQRLYGVHPSIAAWKQAQLSLSRGGLGLRSLSHHAPAAFIASLCFSGLGSISHVHLLQSLEIFNSSVHQSDNIQIGSVLEKLPSQKTLSSILDDNLFRVLQGSLSIADRARLLSASSPHASSWLTVTPSEGQGLHLDPPVFQTALKWWLGLDTAEGSICALCPDKMLDPLGHHATTCKRGGDVVFRHNKLRDILAETCRRAHLSVQVEAGCNLTPDHSHSRPADVLISNWVLGKTAACDISVTSPLNSNIMSEAGVTAGAAAQATELRKHEANDVKCSELGWLCIPLVVESYGAWGKEAMESFSSLASRLAITSSRPKSAVLSELYGRLNLNLVRANVRAIMSRYCPLNSF
ncbi:hypothetical protein EMCRGX_G007398 [Ephydatia muelleri]